MVVDAPNGAHAIDREELRRALLTSSTKRRLAELSSLQHRFAQNCEYSSVRYNFQKTDMFFQHFYLRMSAIFLISFLKPTHFMTTEIRGTQSNSHSLLYYKHRLERMRWQ
jgi:hypothetical protein